MCRRLRSQARKLHSLGLEVVLLLFVLCLLLHLLYVLPFSLFPPVFRIRRIRIFLGLPDLDSLVRGAYPGPSIIKQK